MAKSTFGPIFWIGPVFNCPSPSRDGEKALGLRKRQNLLLGTVPIFWIGPVFNCPSPSRDGEDALGQVLLRKWKNLLLGTVPIFWVGPVFNCPRTSCDGEEALGQVVLRKWQNLLFGTVPIFWVGPVFNCARPTHDGEASLGVVVHFFIIIVEKMAKTTFGYSAHLLGRPISPCLRPSKGQVGQVFYFCMINTLTLGKRVLGTK